MISNALLSLLIVYSISGEQEKTVVGTVRDIKTNESLTGAQVIVNKTDTIYTNFDGAFIVRNVESINTLDVNYPSYQSAKINVDRPQYKTLTMKPIK